MQVAEIARDETAERARLLRVRSYESSWTCPLNGAHNFGTAPWVLPLVIDKR